MYDTTVIVDMIIDSMLKGFDDSGLTPHINEYIISNIPLNTVELRTSKESSKTNIINIDFQMRTWIGEETRWVVSFDDHDYIREICSIITRRVLPGKGDLNPLF